MFSKILWCGIGVVIILDGLGLSAILAVEFIRRLRQGVSSGCPKQAESSSESHDLIKLLEERIAKIETNKDAIELVASLQQSLESLKQQIADNVQQAQQSSNEMEKRMLHSSETLRQLHNELQQKVTDLEADVAKQTELSQCNHDTLENLLKQMKQSDTRRNLASNEYYVKIHGDCLSGPDFKLETTREDGAMLLVCQDDESHAKIYINFRRAFSDIMTTSNGLFGIKLREMFDFGEYSVTDMTECWECTPAECIIANGRFTVVTKGSIELKPALRLSWNNYQ